MKDKGIAMRRWMRAVEGGLLGLASGCGPETVDGPEIEAACGESGPVQLLQLSSTERVTMSSHAIVLHGDRVLIGVGEYASPLPDDLTSLGTQVSARVVSVDECGGDPRTLAEGVDQIHPPGPSGGDWLACNSHTGAIFIIDPDGSEAPQEIGSSEKCEVFSRAGSRWIVLDGQDAGRDLVRADADGLVPFVPGILDLEWSHDESTLFYATTDLRLVEHDLSTSEEQVIDYRVGSFGLSADDRFVAITAEIRPGVSGSWNVLDRESGSQIGVVPGFLHHAGTDFVFIDGDTTIHVDLPSQVRRDIEGVWTVFGIVDDALIVRSEKEDFLARLDLATAELKVLFDGHAVDARLLDGDLWAWVYDPYPGGDAHLARTKLLRIDVDSGEIETVIDDVHQPLGLDDGRWVTVRDQDDDRRGDLWALDPLTGAQTQIDEGVDLHFARLAGRAHWVPPLELHPADEPFFYGIRDAGERTGLWRATLAER